MTLGEGSFQLLKLFLGECRPVASSGGRGTGSVRRRRGGATCTHTSQSGIVTRWRRDSSLGFDQFFEGAFCSCEIGSIVIIRTIKVKSRILLIYGLHTQYFSLWREKYRCVYCVKRKHNSVLKNTHNRWRKSRSRFMETRCISLYIAMSSYQHKTVWNDVIFIRILYLLTFCKYTFISHSLSCEVEVKLNTWTCDFYGEEEYTETYTVVLAHLRTTGPPLARNILFERIRKYNFVIMHVVC